MGGKKEKTAKIRGNKARKKEKAKQKLVGLETKVQDIIALDHNLLS